MRRARVLGALVRRDFAIQRSYRASFTLDLFFGVMNLVIFFYISHAVTVQSGNLQGASTYFGFAAVGLVLMVVMQSATTGLARRIREEQLTGTLEVLVMQPISSPELTLGLTGFPFLFAVVRAGLYIGFADLALGLGAHNANVLGFVLVLATATLALSAIGIALGAIVLVFKQGETLATVVTFGFGLLSGTLFPRALLPGWVQAFGEILPTRFAVDGMRRALFEGTGWGVDVLALSVTAIILLPVASWLFSALLSVVKRTGSLSQY